MLRDTFSRAVVGRATLKMNTHFTSILVFCCTAVFAQKIYEVGVNFRVDPGTQTCFYEHGVTGQMMELYYQVLDGKHGDLDISVDVANPNGTNIISDYKKTQNSIIMQIEQDGDYVICLDNTFSLINSKLVFIYVVVEDRKDNEAEITVVNDKGNEEEETVDWIGTDEDGNTYNIDVNIITNSLTYCLHSVMKARHMLEVYSATKTRDSYLAMEDTFIVDLWSGFQITMMMCVGLVQVYMIKKLFHRQSNAYCQL